MADADDLTNWQGIFDKAIIHIDIVGFSEKTVTYSFGAEVCLDIMFVKIYIYNPYSSSKTLLDV